MVKASSLTRTLAIASPKVEQRKRTIGSACHAAAAPSVPRSSPDRQTASLSALIATSTAAVRLRPCPPHRSEQRGRDLQVHPVFPGLIVRLHREPVLVLNSMRRVLHEDAQQQQLQFRRRPAPRMRPDVPRGSTQRRARSAATDERDPGAGRASERPAARQVCGAANCR